jgi:prophage tail gpP-like protein
MLTEPTIRKPLLGPEPSLTVDGVEFSGWKNVSVSIDVDQTAASFSFSVGRVDKEWTERLVPGKLVELSVAGVKVIKGIIDTRTIKTSGTDESLDLNGRDIMGLLVDSSIGPGFSCIGKTLKNIAQEIIEPFTAEGPRGSGPTLRYGSTGEAVETLQVELTSHNLYDYTIDGIFGWRTRKGVRKFQKNEKIRIDGIVGPETWRALDIEVEGPQGLSVFAQEVGVACKAAPDGDDDTDPTIQSIAGEESVYKKKPKAPDPGEKCEGFLRKLVDEKGAGMWVDANGQLVIGDRAWQRSAAEPTIALYTYKSGNKTQQNNLKDTQVSHTIAGRFSQYQVYGKYQDKKKNMSVSMLAQDRTVSVYKPFFRKLDKADDKNAFIRAAAEERDAGVSNRFELSGTAAGYGQEIDGEVALFTVNAVVRVVHELAGIDEELYISKVTYSCDSSSGPQTSLSLRPLAPMDKWMEVKDSY